MEDLRAAVGEDGAEDGLGRLDGLLAVDVDLLVLVLQDGLGELVAAPQGDEEAEDEVAVADRELGRLRLVVDAEPLPEEADALRLVPVVLDGLDELRRLLVAEGREAKLLEEVLVGERAWAGNG